MRCNVFSNHPIVDVRAENRAYVDEVVVNTLNSPESNSWCARSWNTIMMKGFVHSPRLVLLQDDTDVGNGFADWLNEQILRYDFIWGPAGDQFHYLTIDVLKATGWWDERFIGCYCGDFDFLKRVYFAYDKTRISIDENHPGVAFHHNPCRVGDHVNINAKAIDSTYTNQHVDFLNKGCQTILDSEAFYEAKWGARLPNNGPAINYPNRRIPEIDWYPWFTKKYLQVTDKPSREEIERILGIDELRARFDPAKIANEIVSVQPMPAIDLNALAQHPLWLSFVDRHFPNRKDTPEG